MYNNYYTMKKENKKEVIWPIRMPQELKDQFKAYCDEHGFSMNKKIKILMETEIKTSK